MKAAVWYARHDVKVVDVDEPSVGAHEVKIRVSLCGICGTDIHEYKEGPIIIPSRPHPLTGKLPPVVLGHEFAGVVVETGREVQGFSIGERVTANACLVCHECAWCRKGRYNLCAKLGSIGLCHDGAFAEYLVAPDYVCYRLPPSVTDEMGTFAEPLAVAIHALRRGRLRPGEAVSIVGAGPIGLLVLQAAKLFGAHPIFVVEPIEARRRAALALGATSVFDPVGQQVEKLIHQQTDGLRVDLAVECVGKGETVDLALRLAGKGGRVSVAGIFTAPVPVALHRLQANEKELIGSSAYVDEFSEAVTCLANQQVDVRPLISGTIPLSDIVHAFDDIIACPERHLKPLVSPR